MSLFVVDVEADGPVPGLYSMVSFGAVKVDRGLECSFYGQCAPITEKYLPDALKVSGFTRAQHEGFDPAQKTMREFAQWLVENNEGKMSFVSDNPAFDWSFINYYLHAYAGENPFGHSARRIGDLCAGLKGCWDASSDFKRLRKTTHTHHPVDDAKGNAEALIALCDSHGLKLPGVAAKPVPSLK